MKIKKLYILIILFCGFLFLPPTALARDNVDYWYIKNFDADIILNKDASLTIAETITADCGVATNKHGIFRIVPTRIVTPDKKINTPVRLMSITDLGNRPYEYKTTKDSFNHTLTWKIGSPDFTVKGVNEYKIKYRVDNVVNFNNANVDEFYWNLIGAFWDLEIDNFNVTIHFPKEINRNNSELYYYTGLVGSKLQNLAEYGWLDSNTLQLYSKGGLSKRMGVTASITFPKNIIQKNKAALLRIYSDYLYFLIPLMVFIVCFVIWGKYGDDPEDTRTIIAQYEPPKEMGPLEIAALLNNGVLKKDHVSAGIIYLAVSGFIKIEQVRNKSLFSRDDYVISKDEKQPDDSLGVLELMLYEQLFAEKNSITLSSLKDKFYKKVDKLIKKSKKVLICKGLITGKGLTIRKIYYTIFLAVIYFGFIIMDENMYLAAALAISAIIFVGFGFIMPKRTYGGTQILWHIKGFKLYMNVAEKHRQQFYERENIFEKFLPYAMVFSMAKLWAKKMRDIYGEDYFKHHVPVWYIGSGVNATDFNVGSFVSQMNTLSSSISSNMSSPSGSGGVGGAGGGGGGGGGGGW